MRRKKWRRRKFSTTNTGSAGDVCVVRELETVWAVTVEENILNREYGRIIRGNF
jgi:hypothetical protein